MRHLRLCLIAASTWLAGAGCATDRSTIDEPDPIPDPDPDPDPGVPGVWGSARMLHDLPGNSSAPILRVDSSGRAFALWEQNHPVAPYNRLWASRRVGADWEASTLIASDSNVSSQIYVAGDAANTHAVWKRWINSTWQIVATYAPSGSWEPLTVLRSSTSQQGYLVDPRLAATSSHAAIIWGAEDPVSKRFAIETRVRTATGAWMQIPPVASGIPLATFAGPLYDLAYDDAGALVVTWVERQTDRAEVWARRGIPVDGSLSIAWEAAQKLTTLPAQQNAQVVRQVWSGTHAGRSFAAWLSAEADGSMSIASSHRRPDGVWDTEQATREITSSHYAAPRFAASAGGHKVVLWREPSAESSRMVARRYDPDTGWSNNQIVADNLKAPYLGCLDIDAHYFDVAIDADGNAIALWEERLEEKLQWRSSMGIWSSQFVVGAGWQAPVRIDGGGGRAASIPVGALVKGSVGAALFSSQGEDGRTLLGTNELAPAP